MSRRGRNFALRPKLITAAIQVGRDPDRSPSTHGSRRRCFKKRSDEATSIWPNERRSRCLDIGAKAELVRCGGNSARRFIKPTQGIVAFASRSA
jgi:hypothetical protein